MVQFRNAIGSLNTCMVQIHTYPSGRGRSLDMQALSVVPAEIIKMPMVVAQRR